MRCGRWGLVAGLLVLTFGPPGCRPATPPAVSPEDAVRTDLAVLAADSLLGRFTGTPGAEAAARYVSRRLGEVGVQPGVPGWLQEFAISPTAPGLAGVDEAERPRRGVNVVGLVRGTDPTLREEYVVVGAHYDHLGRGYTGIHAPDQRGQIHNGADDNASGTVALVEIGRRLAADPSRRSVILVAFAGEEFGLIGSDAYVKASASIERTVAMVNLDMVGRLRQDRLLVFGARTAEEFPGLLDSLNTMSRFRFDLQASGDGFGRSDQQSFYLAKKPVLHMFTDLHEDYHRPTDDADRINVAGLVKVAAFTTEVVRAIADRPTAPTLVDAPPPQHAAGPVRTGGYGAYLGTIPDMSGGGPGVRLSGVRAGGPADLAGLTTGDVLVRIGTHPVADLQAMTNALRAHRPGDTVTVVFRRQTTVDSTTVVFGTRGS